MSYKSHQPHLARREESVYILDPGVWPKHAQIVARRSDGAPREQRSWTTSGFSPGLLQRRRGRNDKEDKVEKKDKSDKPDKPDKPGKDEKARGNAKNKPAADPSPVTAQDASEPALPFVVPPPQLPPHEIPPPPSPSTPSTPSPFTPTTPGSANPFTLLPIQTEPPEPFSSRLRFAIPATTSSPTPEPSSPVTAVRTETVVSKITQIATPSTTSRDRATDPPLLIAPTPSPTTAPAKNGFLQDSGRVAGLAVGITIASLILFTVVGWLIVIFIRRRRDREADESFRDELNLHEKGSNRSAGPSGGYEWDPESTFAPPFVKRRSNRHLRTESSASSVIHKIWHHARKTSQGGLALSEILRRKPLPIPPDNSSQVSLTKEAADDDHLPDMPEQAHATTISTRSSDALCVDIPAPALRDNTPQDAPARPQRVARKSLSKLSWSTPTTKTTSLASMSHTQRLPSLASNYAGTVFSEDSEAPRFRTTSSWVLHQQKNLKRNLVDLGHPPSPTVVPGSPTFRSSTLKEDDSDKERLSSKTLG
ncbi:hypothetical protein LOZ58_002730 [Ophidiomyces ophidiicola]|nr:hypothetical protein LOZ58_002730 [Ophidiomyces ophidiicola]